MGYQSIYWQTSHYSFISQPLRIVYLFTLLKTRMYPHILTNSDVSRKLDLRSRNTRKSRFFGFSNSAVILNSAAAI